MPYSSREELPPGVRAELPLRAQDIYRAAFNTAFDSYQSTASSEDRRGSHDSREESAHKAAWAAVKARYERGSGGVWHEIVSSK